ncbi:hypothetical protein [Archangium primigenium]|uniref:hypothetical protein n=1 Tax=[Archangium] primigenium TaxID=2792470 RepID=UPI001EF7EE4C|nr:hypothetical protein [Archangium primigenium]
MRPSRGLTRGQEKDEVLLGLIEANASFEQRRHALLALEKRWLREARTERERQRIQCGIAEDLVTLAYSFNRPWAEFGKWLRRVERLGFSNLALRVHVACLFVLSLQRFPRRARAAWRLLADAERRVRCLRRDDPLRAEHLDSIAHAKAQAEVSRPPGT